jgi:hypothetical protein
MREFKANIIKDLNYYYFVDHVKKSFWHHRYNKIIALYLNYVIIRENILIIDKF